MNFYRTSVLLLIVFLTPMAHVHSAFSANLSAEELLHAPADFVRDTTYEFADKTTKGLVHFSKTGQEVFSRSYTAFRESARFADIFITSIGIEVGHTGSLFLASGMDAVDVMVGGLDVVAQVFNDTNDATARGAYEFGRATGDGFLALGYYPYAIHEYASTVMRETKFVLLTRDALRESGENARYAFSAMTFDAPSFARTNFDEESAEQLPVRKQSHADLSQSLTASVGGVWDNFASEIGTVWKDAKDTFNKLFASDEYPYYVFNNEEGVYQHTVMDSADSEAFPQQAPTSEDSTQTSIVREIVERVVERDYETTVIDQTTYVSSGGITLTELAIGLAGLRAELVPQIELAMRRPRTESHSSGGGGGSNDDVDLSGYLELAGGTLTGALGGTSAVFSGALSSATLSVAGTTTLSGVAYDFPNADGTSGQLLTTDGTGGLSWTTVAGGVGTTTWGTIEGTLSNQTDLQTALDAKLSTTTAASTYTPLTRTLEIAGTADQITSSAGAQDLSGNRTWTLSLPSFVSFPGSYSASAGTTTNATSTNLAVTGTFNFLGTAISDVSTWFAGLFDSNLALKDTDDLDEGVTNFYYTDERVGDYITGSTTLAVDLNYWTEDSGNVYRLSGDVGIGTDSPDTLLDIEGLSPAITLADNRIATNFQTYQLRSSAVGAGFDIFDTTQNATRVLVDSDGRFAIGTTTIPSESKVFVYGGASGANVDIRSSTNVNPATVEVQSYDFTDSFKSAYLQFNGPNAAGTVLGGTVARANLGVLAFQNSTNALIYTNNEAPIIFGTDATERMRISDTGNVGIGDTSPAALFTVGASDAFQVNSSGRVLANVGASGAGNLGYSFVGDIDTGFYRSASDEISLQTGGTTRVTVNSTGQLVTTGVIRAADGNASAPGYGFSATGSIGMYRDGGNQLILRNSGLLGVRIHSDNGPISFGPGSSAASATSRLDLLKIGSTDIQMAFNTSGGYITYANTADTLTFASSTGGYIFSDGNVGIGDTTPEARLSIVGEYGGFGEAPAVLTVAGGEGGNESIGPDSNGFAGGRISLTTGEGGFGEGSAVAGDGGVFSVTSGDGGEGYGFFTVGGTGGALLFTSGSGGVADYGGDGGDIIFTLGEGAVGGDTTGRDGYLILAPNAGLVGIGTTTPSQKLTVDGNMFLTGALYDSTNSAGTAGYVLQSTGTGLAWVATSTLGITGGGGGSFFTDDGALLRSTNGEGIQVSHIVSTSTATSTFAGDILMSGHIIPSITDTWDLGTPGAQWRDLYLSEGSLYIDGQKVLQSDNETIVVSADINQSLRLQTAGSGDIELNATGAGLITLKSNIQITGGKTITTSDNSALLFSDGTRSGNISIAGNTISSANTNGDIDLDPNGVGNTYVSSGNFGIGTTTPGYDLVVAGDAQIGGALRDSTNSAGTSGHVLQSTGTGMAWVATSTLGISGGGGASNWTLSGSNVYRTTGSVGIGTSAPLAPLHVGTTMSDYASLSFADTGAVITAPTGDQTAAESNVLTLMRDGTNGVTYAGAARFDMSRWETSSTNARTALDIKLSHASTDNLVSVLTLRSNGNVGIGATAPISLLEVQGGLTTTGSILTLGTKETTVVANDILGRLNFYAPLEADGSDAILTGASIAARAEGTFSASSNATSLFFQTGSSEAATTKMTITSAGNVGIGRTDPIHNLDIEDTLPVIRLSTTAINPVGRTELKFAEADNDLFALSMDAAGSGSANKLHVRTGGTTDMMTFTYGGNVGIGNTDPGSKLEVGTFNTSNSNIKTGSLELQPYAINSAFLTENAYFDGSSWRYRAAGTAGGLIFASGEGQFRFFTSGSAGAALPSSGQSTQFKVNADGTVAIGGTISSTAGTYTGAALVAKSSGNVGIGELDPDHNLDIEDTLPVLRLKTAGINPVGRTELKFSEGGFESFALSFDASGSGNANNLHLRAADTTDMVTFNMGGNVGVGDTSPAALFTVGASDAFQVSSSGRVLANVGASGAGNLGYSFVGDTDTGLYRSAADEVRIQTGGSDRMTINSSGRVGIGLTDQTSALHVNGGTGTLATGIGIGAASTGSTNGTGFYESSAGVLRITNSGTDGYRMVFDSNRIYSRYASGEGFSIFADQGSATNPIYGFNGDGGLGMWRSADDTLAFTAGGTNRLTIGTGSVVISTNVGIKDAVNPQEALHIFNGNLRIEGDGQDNYINLGSDAELSATQAYLWSEDGLGFAVGATTTTPQLVVEAATGNVGIGTTTLDFGLTVDGTVGFHNIGDVTSGSDRNLCLNSVTGGVFFSSDCSSSSERYKHGINTLEDGLDTINVLRPVSFRYNVNNEAHLGLIAEEVELIDERLVFYQESTGNIQGVRYQSIIPILIKAVQELDAKIELLLANAADGVSNFFEIIAERMTTKELCLEDVCITKTELQQLLDSAQVDSYTPPAPEEEPEVIENGEGNGEGDAGELPEGEAPQDGGEGEGVGDGVPGDDEPLDDQPAAGNGDGVIDDEPVVGDEGGVGEDGDEPVDDGEQPEAPQEDPEGEDVAGDEVAEEEEESEEPAPQQEESSEDDSPAGESNDTPPAEGASQE